MLFEGGGVPDRQAHGLLQADRAGESPARDVKRRAVVDRGAQDGHARGDGDGALEVKRLGGDMSLVVVQAQHAVVAPGERLGED